jgi:hypothetical protein
MKTIVSAVVLSLTVMSSAYAGSRAPSGELDYPPAVEQTSTLTRAQVLADLQAAKDAGQVTFGELELPKTPVASTTLTREQVKAAAEQASSNGAVSFGDQDNQPFRG